MILTFQRGKVFLPCPSEGVDKVDTLRRNQDFDELKQKNKQTSSIGINASKLAVFLGGSKFRLRILFGKLLTVQEGTAGKACFAKQSNEQFVSRTLPLLKNYFVYSLRGTRYFYLAPLRYRFKK